MSLDKRILHGKKHRRQYRGSKVCGACPNHGSCEYCRKNRLHNGKKRLLRVADAAADFPHPGGTYSVHRD